MIDVFAGRREIWTRAAAGELILERNGALSCTIESAKLIAHQEDAELTVVYKVWWGYPLRQDDVSVNFVFTLDPRCQAGFLRVTISGEMEDEYTYHEQTLVAGERVADVVDAIAEPHLNLERLPEKAIATVLESAKNLFKGGDDENHQN